MIKFKKSIGIWNPEQQKEITGKVRAINPDFEMKGYKYVQYVLETEDAIISVLGATVLDKIIQSINVQIGETIKINFLGMKKPQGDGSEYKDFEVSLGV